MDILTEKKKAVDDVRDFSILREAQKELRIKYRFRFIGVALTLKGESWR
jgi:hypothetical protein